MLIFGRRLLDGVGRTASVAVALFGLAILAGLAAMYSQSELAIKLGAAVAASAMRPPSHTSLNPTPVVQDFSQKLPPASSLPARAHTLIATSHHWAARHAVRWVSASIPSSQPAPRALAHTEISLTLEGSYPKIKQVLADTLSHTPNVVLHRLELQRQPQGAEVQAQLVFWLLAKPAPTQ